MVQSRRQIILSLALSAAFFGTIWPWHESRRSVAVLLPLLKSRLQQVFSDLDAGRDLGRHYLAAFPEEASLPRLTQGLLTFEALRSSQAFVERIAALRTRDFENEDMVSVDGWVLARVEARLCALLCRV